MMTLARPLKEEEAELVDETLPQLLQAQIKEGQISDELFDTLQYPSDVDLNYTQLQNRPSGATLEPQQRSKCISHEFQCNLCQQQITAQRDKEKKANAMHKKEIELHIAQNKECEEKLLAQLRKEKIECNLNNATMKPFVGPTVPLLQSFCLVQEFEESTKKQKHSSSTWKKQPAKKGTQDENLTVFDGWTR